MAKKVAHNNMGVSAIPNVFAFKEVSLYGQKHLQMTSKSDSFWSFTQQFLGLQLIPLSLSSAFFKN